MQQRRDEILAKRAKLAELKRQRELRASQLQGPGRQSLGAPSDLASPQPSRASTRLDIDALIDHLVGDSRPASTTGAASPGPKGSRPTSVVSAGELSNETSEPAAATANSQSQVLTTAPLTTIYETPPSPVKEVFSYSKGVQTTEEWMTTPTKPRALPDLSDDDEPLSTPSSKRLSRRERDREEEIRQKLRQEIEEELRATKDLLDNGTHKPTTAASNFPARTLTTEELAAVTHSDDFFDFLDRSTKVIEKALSEYDILTDYTLQQHDADDEDDHLHGANTGGKGRRKIREVAQFYDERWSKKRMVSSIDWSPKYKELLLASYTKNPSSPHEPDGVVQVWNMHLPERPELVFHAQSDILVAKFSPFHPNLIVGGAYSGQVLLWDTRSRSPAPVQKTPLTGSGHTHPVYAVDLVGTQNANNIISVSTDGAVCGWSVDMLSQPQESLTLLAPAPAKTDDLSPTCVAFPQADPTFFLVGSEEGTIFPCHRYDRAGAKAGVDARVAYKGHAAPVVSVDFHPARGPVDLGDLVLSASLDWSVKLWKVRAPAATSGIAAGGGQGAGAGGGGGGVTSVGLVSGAGGNVVDGYVVSPLMEFVREDVVYDAKWSPTRPGVFALVDGAGWAEVWDLTVETEEPVARVSPSQRRDGRVGVAWEAGEGKRLATGGIDGAVTVFEVGVDLGGKEGVKGEEWTAVKKLVGRIEAQGVNGVGV
ncbi:WD40 repeat-like protein [Coniochaeta ligniaria NRRL 30616]|uniref:WD40 repeat-like protein n=1 Tax=Coniochaeta ligniaria NRRL 30616 TaxID=1408157 RepID=A0A1J7JQ73_9PEZI|nr:WD40 repeat-like protein [Coniochaeta ligniaria NRRL 30616]